MAPLLGPGSGAVKDAIGTGRLGGVEIFRVSHCAAVGILVVGVSAWSWVQRLVMVDRVLYRACRPLGNVLVYVFRHWEERVIHAVLIHATSGV